MVRMVLMKTLLGIYLSVIWCVTVNSSRAELGTYLHIKELPTSEETLADHYVLAFINYTYRTSDGKEIQFSEEKARYGEGRIMNVQGNLIHITSADDFNNHTGCSTDIRGTNGNTLPDPIKGVPWIALIRRGDCSFEQKIKYAWYKRAAGVIIYNDKNAVNLEKMKLEEKDRNITAVFTFKSIGEEMARIVDEGNNVWISVSEGQRGVRPITNINKTSVLFVSISFIVLMIISLVWLIFYYVQRFRYLQSKDQHSRHLCTVAKRIIGKIPTKTGKCEDKDSENDCCAICIEPYKPTDCIRVLPCKHEFHKNCIDPWLLEHRTCPMCKLDVLKHYGFVFIGSEESILQLDLDMEIGGVNGSDDDHLSVYHPRINVTTPTFNIQTFDGNGHLLRGSSLESLDVIEREILPERSQSSMSSCVNRIVNHSIDNKSYQTMNSCKDNNSMPTKTIDSNLLTPGNSKRDKESISLPCTLKKLKTNDSCRGSNNCYSKATTDLKQLANRIDKGYPKSRTTYVRHQSNDDELLLLSGEKTESDTKQEDSLENVKIVNENNDEIDK